MLTTARQQHANGLCSQARLDLLHAKAEAAQHAWLPKSVPGAYTVLDPLAVDMDGPAELAWLREPHLSITPELATAVRKPTPAQMRVIEQMPPEIVSQIRAGHSKVWLSPNICQVCFLDKQPYERYPTPISRHCFDALEFKQDLMAMDRATIRTVKNRILKLRM